MTRWQARAVGRCTHWFADRWSETRGGKGDWDAVQDPRCSGESVAKANELYRRFVMHTSCFFTCSYRYEFLSGCDTVRLHHPNPLYMLPSLFRCPIMLFLRHNPRHGGLDLGSMTSSLTAFLPPTMLPDLQARLDGIRLQEKPIDFFEAEIRGFGIGKVYQGHEGNVEAHEYQVCLPLKVCDNRRSDHNNEEIPNRLS